MATKEDVTYRVGRKKIKAWNRNPEYLYRHMECKLCGDMTEVVEDVTAVTCHLCVNQMSDIPTTIQKKKSDKPPGWHFMNQYVHKDGVVYYKGVEQPELKGTLPVTKIKKKINNKPKLTKFQRKDARARVLVKMHSLKKELKKAKFKKDTKRINSSLKKLQRELKKYN